jgi:predicted DNA-binding protein
MPRKNIKRSIAISSEMHDLLTQIAAQRGRDTTESHLIREAIRHYLDEQGDLVSSRRHFQKSLQLRLDRLERSLIFQMNVLVCLLAALLDDPNAIDEAIIAARRDGASLLAQIAAIRDMEDTQ